MGVPRIILKPTPFLRKQTGQMFKLFNLWEKYKNPSKWHRDLSKQPTAPPIAKEGRPVFLERTQGLNSGFVTRRQIMLNRHFTEIISDVLVNNLKTHIDELNVTITSIESKAWNKGVNVFYYTQRPFNEMTHKKLNSLVGSLRSAIAERNLIGRTPPITFVYDEVSEIERSLEESLKLAEIKRIEPTTELEEIKSKKVVVKKGTIESESKLNIMNFSAPPDMTNKALGLDHVSLYNKVASKLERGRGQSERIHSGTSLASTGPIIRLPSEETTEEDPIDRIKAMQRFIINQRKKKEHLARLRRKQELLHRDSIKWDLPEDKSDEQPVRELHDEEL